MQFNLTIKADTVVSAKAIRESLVEGAFMAAAQQVHNGAWTRDNAVKALAPLVDTLTTGTKAKGHADAVRAVVQSNLDTALEAISAAQDDDSTDTAPDTPESDSVPVEAPKRRKAA
jgi:hypothetical protein